MKIKRMVYKDFEEKFGGLKRLKTKRKDGELVHHGANSIVPVRYMASICRNRKKDCTYVALTCLGYLDIFGPRVNNLTVLCRFEGEVTAEDLIDDKFKYRSEVNAVIEELELDWRRRMDSKD